VTVFCYHTFDSRTPTDFTLSSARFNEQLRFLYVQKIPVIPLSALEDHLAKGTPLPERSVVITIDDGYKSAKTIAWPILQRYGFPFTLYVYPHAISHLKGSLTWDDLRLMAGAGADIESHTQTHPFLTHPEVAMNQKDYQAWIDYEVSESKHRIEEELKRPVTSLAYPYGGYDEFVAERVKLAGYHTALTCEDGDVDRFTDPWRLNRRLIFHNTSLKTFAYAFLHKPLQLADLSPRDGERTPETPLEITARIVNFPQIQMDTVQILVNKIDRHWHGIAIDPKTGKFSFKVPPHARHGHYFASLIAQDKTNPAIKREASWSFIVRRNVSK